MTDTLRKTDSIRRIQNLKLSPYFVQALDDEIAAEAVLEAITYLEKFSEHWH